MVVSPDGEEPEHRSLSEIIDEAFPYYLAIGMSAEQFWNEDSSFLIAYRKAWDIQQDHENRLAWLQGMYFYEALCDVSPVLRAFAKPGTRAHEYAKKPLEFNKPNRKSKKETEREKIENTRKHMQELMMRFNRSFDERKKREETQNEENPPKGSDQS